MRTDVPALRFIMNCADRLVFVYDAIIAVVLRKRSLCRKVAFMVANPISMYPAGAVSFWLIFLWASRSTLRATT